MPARTVGDTLQPQEHRGVIDQQGEGRRHMDAAALPPTYRPDVSAGRREAVDGHVSRVIDKNRHEERSPRNVNTANLQAAKALLNDLR